MHECDGRFWSKGGVGVGWRGSLAWRAKQWARCWPIQCRRDIQRQQPVRRPKLGPWQGVIDAIAEDDKQRPRKQRHTERHLLEARLSKHASREYIHVLRLLETFAVEEVTAAVEDG